MISWLEKTPLFPKFYFQQRGQSTAIAACGKASGQGDFAVGAHTFFPLCANDSLWEGFSSSNFFTPLALRKGQATAHLPLLPSPVRQLFSPGRQTWIDTVKATQAHMKHTPLEKVVLARLATLIFAEALNPWDLLRLLQATSIHATVFALQIDRSACFLGATPEFLYLRNHRSLTTEALAGTCPILAPNDALLLSGKQRREFSFVKEGIARVLTPLCADFSWQGADAIVHTTRVKHLHNEMRATLKPHVTDAHLLSALHPTPAMGGTPTHSALEWITKVEPFARGLYAAPIGWMDRDRASFAVGIRSALIKENKLHLFSGAGIILDSDPQGEWDELDAKISPFTQHFSIPCH